MKMKTATENIETKMVFLSETESENDFSLYRPFRKLLYLYGNLPPVLPYFRDPTVFEAQPNTYFLGPIARGLPYWPSLSG